MAKIRSYLIFYSVTCETLQNNFKAFGNIKLCKKNTEKVKILRVYSAVYKNRVTGKGRTNNKWKILFIGGRA